MNNSSITYRKIFSSHFLVGFLKFALSAILLLLLYKELHNKQILWLQFKNAINEVSIFYFMASLSLMALNWYCEIIKWKTLTDTFNPLTKRQLFDSIISGITLGIMTPSRIGEYAGRLMHIKSEHRTKAITASLLCSLSQNIVNITAGAIAILCYHNVTNNWSTSVVMSIFSIACVALIFMYFILINNDPVLTMVEKSFLPSKLKFFFARAHLNFNEYDGIQHSLIASSLLRFVIYLSQYALLLYAYQCNIPLPSALIGIAVIFLIQSGLPLPPVMSMVARAELAVFVFSPFDTNAISLIAATFTLWVINLLLPALGGMAILLKTKFNTENE